MFKPAQARLCSDEELLQHHRRSGDAAWLGALLERHTVLLLGIAYKYLSDKEAAQDAVQHVFTKALTHLPKEEIHNIKGWLYVLLRNHCLQIIRDTRHFAPEETIGQVAGEDSKEAAESLRIREHSIEALEAALPQLAEAQRTCITLFYLRQQSYEQIGRQTGYTFKEVKTHIQNGKRNLRIALQKIVQTPPGQ
jgi:RNA polymerase sigma-70 factor (ECF subfamily)